MSLTALFIINSIVLGAGLAADAFSVSLVNGMSEPGMKRSTMILSSAVFAVFQGVMPMTGYLMVTAAVSHFGTLSSYVPWAAVAILMVLGVRMLVSGDAGSTGSGTARITAWTLLVQGVATSIDALSVGFVISEFPFSSAAVCACIISAVTFAVCYAGVLIGKKAGVRLCGRASLFGGIILLAVAAELLLSMILG